MVVKMEKHMQLSVGNMDHISLQANLVENSRFTNRNLPGHKFQNSKFQSSSQPSYVRPDKSHLKCDHCGKRGHIKAECFKLRGFPDWWPGLKRGSKPRVHAVLEDGFNQDTHLANLPRRVQPDLKDLIASLVQQEMGKHSQSSAADVSCNASFTGFDHDHFSGSFLPTVSKQVATKILWIIDSGASTHM